MYKDSVHHFRVSNVINKISAYVNVLKISESFCLVKAINIRDYNF